MRRQIAARSTASGSAPARPASPAVAAGDTLASANTFSTEIGGFGVYQAGNAGVVVVANDAPATAVLMTRHAHEIKQFDVSLRRSRFTTSSMSAYSAMTRSPAALGIPTRYGFMSYYDAQKDVFEVASDAPSALLRSIALKHPGTMEIGPGQMRFAANRFDDKYPYYGASAIKTDHGMCTAGVPVMNIFGATFLTTAAHCAPLHSKVYMQGGSHNYVGTVYHRNPSIDTSLIETEVGGYIWTGGWYRSTSHLPIGYALTPYVGMKDLYTGGARTYNQPNKRVVEANVNFCQGGQCWYHGFCVAGGKLTNSGDSGGPIYAVNSGRANIVGVIIGEEGNTTCGVSIVAILHDYTLKLIS